jgi:hypothetical protein
MAKSGRLFPSLKARFAIKNNTVCQEKNAYLGNYKKIQSLQVYTLSEPPFYFEKMQMICSPVAPVPFTHHVWSESHKY